MSCKAKLAGPGDREAAIRSPLEILLKAAGQHLGVQAVFHDEVRDADRRVRPDYGVTVAGAVIGYIEVKAPGRTIDPDRFTGHDLEQWNRQRDLPNLIYTNGTHWRLYRDGALRVGPIVLDGGPLQDAGGQLRAPDGLESLLVAFLRWYPEPITSVGALVRAVAPLTRLLRGEVLDQLTAEEHAVAAGADADLQPFTGLARDWRKLLFPHADNITFADGYAQTVTFALLLARTENIPITDTALHQVGTRLSAGHSLMGKALQLLTDDVVADFHVTLSLLVRVVGAVDWPRIRDSGRDTYLHLYEHFLELYDNNLRKRSGSYYTPREVVEQMVRLVEEALVTRLGKAAGFRDKTVLTVDPAMGTGTYLHTILDIAARAAERDDGPGAVAGVVSQVASRLIGFEMQMGPFAVAELRTADLLASYGAQPPAGEGMRLYVTDTLDDPRAAQVELGSALQTIARSRQRANKVKANAAVTVVIGNPPYKEQAAGEGAWVENGGEGQAPILDDFLTGVPGKIRAKIKNLYVYFWRWATWKVWESTSHHDTGIICFISTSGYLTGSAFTAMREYLRRYASEGWIIDLTPEGQTPDIPTRVFPGVRQPLAIGLFLRTPDTTHEMPAKIRYRTVTGRRDDKFAALTHIRLDDDGWREARSDWTAPLTAAATGCWDTYPAVQELMPWYSPGVFPTRTWVYSPDRDTLIRRWKRLLGETDPDQQDLLFKKGRDATPEKAKKPLPGTDTHRNTLHPVRSDHTTEPTPVRVTFRAFDRQWILPDSRLMDMPRTDLWESRIPGQIFVVEQHTHSINSGPGLIFTGLIPDYHCFNNRGGRVLPFLHPDATPNLAPGLPAALASTLGTPVSPGDVLAYIAAVVAHPAYTRTFTEELTTPGIRVPLTADPELWTTATALGEQILWLHTYGAVTTGPDYPAGTIRFPHGDPRQPLATKAITTMPDELGYNESRHAVILGSGEIGPVSQEALKYAVGGKEIVKSWFNYRKKEPGGRRATPLDDINPTAWNPDWTTELIDLLTVITRLIDLEPLQADLLTHVLAAPVQTYKSLQVGGTRWPSEQKDRRPRRGLTGNDTPGTLDL
ncbi:type ISP restriction/modification enzyme [Frankia canadensis]|uniref:type ISP restriction/modification enzyme n=1 Tax=Frankia canadensis TaxID=1836972 RepID=UPI001FAF0315|nr:type ISP restriction/modification enzyme [Frankia canadensis]